MRLVAPLLCLIIPAGGAGGAPIDGTWELTRIFRTGSLPGARTVPLDSTTYVRFTVVTSTGGWIGGNMERWYLGQLERSRLNGAEAEGRGRYIVSYRLKLPVWTRGESVAWMVGDTLRLGTALVPDADSIEFRRVAAGAPYPKTVTEIVSAR